MRVLGVITFATIEASRLELPAEQTECRTF